MLQDSAVAVFDWLDTWSDGDLVEFAGRMRDAPQRQVRALIEDWPRERHVLDELAPGVLRPLINGLAGEQEMVAASTRLLLYTGQVVVRSELLDPYIFRLDDPYFDSRELSSAIVQLAVLRPLVEDGSLLFTDGKHDAIGWHPSRFFSYQDALSSARDAAWDTDDPTFAAFGLGGLAREIAGSVVTLERGQATPLALTRNEQLAYEAVFSGHSIDARISEMKKLAKLRLPDFGVDPSSLVELRATSDALFEFREALAVAMRAVAEIPDSGAAEQEAQGIIADVLVSRTQRLEAEAARWPQRLASGATRLLMFTGLGAAAGAGATVAFGSAAAGALAGAVSGAATEMTSGGLEEIRGAVRGMKDRQHSRAIWNVVTEFRPS
jgi:hypothetical protein